jgi:hypothetical protein
MLPSSQVIEPGYYRYYDGSGSPPVVVEIAPAEAPEPQLEVRFHGRDDWDVLADLTGEFEGPLRPSRG